MKTNCLIVDDEPLSVNIVKEYLSKFDEYTIIGSAHNALDALKHIEKKHIDLLFLDINMPELNGFELIKTIQQPPKIIVISAFKEFALEGYELNIVDFLLKPFSFERFLKAINKYNRTFTKTKPAPTNEFAGHFKDTIHLKENKRTINLKIDDIVLIESMRDYVKIHSSADIITIKSTLHHIYNLLPQYSFCRIHKSFIIAMNKVSAYSTTHVEINNKKIPIGKIYKNEVLKKLDNLGILL